MMILSSLLLSEYQWRNREQDNRRREVVAEHQREEPRLWRPGAGQKTRAARR